MGCGDTGNQYVLVSIMVRIEDYCDIADGGLVIRGRLQQYIRQNIITCDPVMLRQLDMLDRLSASNVPLTILGEAGCGKDSIAQYAHDVSARKNKPFLKINCAYLTEDLVTAELFGTEHFEQGLLCRAQGGSLYIENVNLLSSRTQYRLMEHIRATDGKANDTRYIIYPQSMSAARERQLIEPLIDYFNASPFLIPPLRERPADIILLTIQHLYQIHDNLGLERTVSPEVMTALLNYDWPGNIRQLTSVLERMAFMSDNVLMDSVSLLQRCLTANKQFQRMQAVVETPPQPKTLKELMAEYEIKIIHQYIAQYGTLRKAAAALGVTHSLLSYKLKKHEETAGNQTKE